MNHRPYTEGGCRNCGCDGFKLPVESGEEAPLPRCDHCKQPGHSFEDCPEEEACNACGHSVGEGCGCPAHAFVSKAHCHRCEGTWLIKNAMVEDAEPPPPQPLRRPPYAVAYSVAGHLYEIALPGDATVQATDGGLIITHALGPVAGVVRVHPIEGEQS